MSILIYSLWRKNKDVQVANRGHAQKPLFLKLRVSRRKLRVRFRVSSLRAQNLFGIVCFSFACLFASLLDCLFVCLLACLIACVCACVRACAAVCVGGSRALAKFEYVIFIGFA